MSKTFLGLTMASLFVVSGTAFADHFQFSSPGGVVWNGVYVNPYTATVDQAGGHFALDTVLTVYCDDWNTDFSGTPTWTADVYHLDQIAQLRYGNTTLNYNFTYDDGSKKISPTLPSGTADPLHRYLEAAWLDSQWEKEVAQNPLHPSTDIQKRLAAAAWTLFVDSSHVSGLVSAINDTSDSPLFARDVYNYLLAAQQALLPIADGGEGFTGAGWDVIVPRGDRARGDGGPMQEFLVHELSTVPEPGSIILLGSITGFLAIRKFRRKRQA